MKPQTAWAVSAGDNSKSVILLWTIRLNRESAKAVFLRSWPSEIWKSLRKQGFRLTKVTVQEVAK